MAQYFYIAKSKKDGRTVSDILVVENEKELAKTLREDNLLLIQAEKITKKKGISFLGGVSLSDKIFLTRNLQMMLSSGLSFSRTLKILSLQTKSKRLRGALLDIREEIHQGNNFSGAMEKHPDVFSKVFQSIVQVSEETGTLEENLDVLTEQLEKEHELKSKVKGAMIYPAVILFTMIVVGIVMLVMVVPKLAQTFESMDVALPLTTQFIIGLGTFLEKNWLFIPFFFASVFYLIKAILKSKKGKKAFDFLSLKIPVLSPLIRKSNSAYVARTLNSLISSGVSLVRGLQIVSETVSNHYFKESVSSSIKTVKEGGKLSEAFKLNSDLYSLIMIQMIEVGEETGKTSEVLEKTAQFLEEEVFSLTRNLTSVIEPALMIIMGVTVGFFAISMLMPMYSLIEVL